MNRFHVQFFAIPSIITILKTEYLVYPHSSLGFTLCPLNPQKARTSARVPEGGAGIPKEPLYLQAVLEGAFQFPGEELAN
jgi:hypothetical protein